MTEALGWIGSALLLLSLTQRDMLHLRQLNLAASALLLVFNALMLIPSMVVLNGILVAVNLYHLVKVSRSRRKERVDVGQELRPGRFRRADEMARAVEQHQAAVGDERGKVARL